MSLGQTLTQFININILFAIRSTFTSGIFHDPLWTSAQLTITWNYQNGQNLNILYFDIWMSEHCLRRLEILKIFCLSRRWFYRWYFFASNATWLRDVTYVLCAPLVLCRRTKFISILKANVGVHKLSLGALSSRSAASDDDVRILTKRLNGQETRSVVSNLIPRQRQVWPSRYSPEQGLASHPSPAVGFLRIFSGCFSELYPSERAVARGFTAPSREHQSSARVSLLFSAASKPRDTPCLNRLCVSDRVN